jgi:Ca2+-binding RTX toxin-like protein
VFLLGAPEEAGDMIADFTTGEDVLWLAGAAFGLPAGGLGGALTPGGAARFIVAGDNRATAEAGAWQFILNTAAGVLLLDSNGIEAGGRLVIAQLDGAAIAATDIVIG